jgi:hypothetical protein
MHYDADLHETRTDADQSEIGGDFRVSFESEDARLHYSEHQLRPAAGYSGFTDCWTDAEAREILAELLTRFPIYQLNRFPLPPYGLPGFVAEGFTEDAPAAKLIEIGLAYAAAVIRSQPRAMHLRWQDAAQFIREIESRVEGKTIADWIAANTNDVESRKAAQQVYFIGAASGPIKIGIAVRPTDRLKGLQTSHHERLELLAVCKGGQARESAYHKQFTAHRLHGEWFERCPEIEAEIERLNNRTTP